MSDALDRFAAAFNRHWIRYLVTALLVYSGLPVLAPLLKAAGFDGAAQMLYTPYKAMCHTYGFRSFYLFGEQAVYSRDEFERVSGIDTGTNAGLLAARNFQGDAQTGYKIAICQRDMAIYPAMALGGGLYGLWRGRMRKLPWWLFVLIGVGPIGLDGFSQLLSQPPFNLLPYRESVWQLRVLTGALFGFSAAWLVFPLLAAGMPVADADCE